MFISSFWYTVILTLGWLIWGLPVILVWMQIFAKANTMTHRSIITISCLCYCCFFVILPWFYFCINYLSILVR